MADDEKYGAVQWKKKIEKKNLLKKKKKKTVVVGGGTRLSWRTIDTMRVLPARPSINTSSPAASSLTMGVMNIHRISFSFYFLYVWRAACCCWCPALSLSLWCLFFSFGFYGFNSHRLRLRREGKGGELKVKSRLVLLGYNKKEIPGFD